MNAPVSMSAPRDPAASLSHARAQWGGSDDLWVFGYASLIWRPGFDAVEQRPARVHGFHRALKMRSRVNRGTPQCPGLVFALLSGGSCRGVALRIERERVDEELARLWAREMPNAVYDARWLPCRTPQGEMRALGFTLSRASPNYTGALDDAQMLEILRSASGRYGSTLEYLLETASGLDALGIRDPEIERLVALARLHELAP
jgi:glutathione-specific gamma-glutamylcyclotransferase